LKLVFHDGQAMYGEKTLRSCGKEQVFSYDIIASLHKQEWTGNRTEIAGSTTAELPTWVLAFADLTAFFDGWFAGGAM